MKIIVRNIDNAAIYCLADDEIVSLNKEQMIIGNPPKFLVNDCNNENVTIYDGITAPDDWRGEKYLYVDGEWLLNPDYIEPVIEQEPE